MARGGNFYNDNAQRTWPIEESATGLDDQGATVPLDILVDAKLRWPHYYGSFAYIMALTATPNLVTVIFGLSTDANTASSETIAAVLNIPQPVDPYRIYPISALEDGVTGWVVFGPGVSGTNYNGRFATPAQSRLAPGAARPYRQALVSGIRREGSSALLTGLVTFKGEGELIISQKDVTIAGYDDPVPAIVFDLASNPTKDNQARYVGPCGGRPESKTCRVPGIERLGTISPDCAGDIVLTVRGLDIWPFTGNQGGFALDLNLGLSEVCGGTSALPSDYDDRCSSSLESESSSVESSSISVSSVVLPCPDIPYLINFTTCSDPPSNWDVISGQFAFVTTSERSYQAQSTAERNISIWSAFNACGLDSSLDKSALVQLRLYEGVQANGGVVLNYRLDPLSGLANYLLVLLNARTNALELWTYNGTSSGILTATSLNFAKPILYGDWYELSVRAALTAPGGPVSLTATATGITDPSWPTVLVSINTTRYGIGDGQPGLGSIRGKTDFRQFIYHSA